MNDYDVLKEIVRNGSDLTLCRPIDDDVLRELASLAKETGAKLTVRTKMMNYETILEISATYSKSVSFVYGLEKFEKDN
jgi:hypothetical protein